ncbi:hypothetical protein [Lapillicoccus jejuensis]|uniref:Uncharacterized protein n=1 Tax=Lapillicoccus jejuensis TaxID=402171 RepID=A0A542DVT2_9MICO|nr:hypothetical protein [Lapillicoccus jejuensis]TQJ07212.1 hypothetical protein FB458_0267 [Lapillicoccus jejuensis]
MLTARAARPLYGTVAAVGPVPAEVLQLLRETSGSDPLRAAAWLRSGAIEPAALALVLRAAVHAGQLGIAGTPTSAWGYKEMETLRQPDDLA